VLYFRRHVLQIFDIPVRLGAAETVEPGSGALRAEVVFSRMSQIRDVDALPERTLAVATNASAGGTHRFMFDDGEDIAVSEALAGQAQRTLRETLGSALGQAGRRSALSPKRFATVVKTLATAGADIWDHVDTNASEGLSDRFAELRAASGCRIQIVRLHPEFAFPFAMLYDWALPSAVEDVERAPVCPGVDGGATTCTCDPDAGTTVCVRGFWGVRHVIEEFVREEDAQEHIGRVAAAAGAPAVVCTVGDEGDDRWSREMVTTLEGTLGTDRFEQFRADNSLYGRLWDEAQRPAVLIALGHLTRRRVRTEPAGPRIYVRATERFINPRALSDTRRERGRWRSPQRPIVLLLACNSADDALGEVHSFVARLASAGAAAVIATEQKVDTRLAAGASTSVVQSLATAGPGEALRRWRAQLLADGDPFGFLFTCFGSADVTVAGLAPGITAAAESPA
jgi:hypothetical protein